MPFAMRRAIAYPLAQMSKILPRGWRDLFVQLGIWFGFLFAYQIARGLAGHSSAVAFQNGQLIIDTERKLHALVELDIQHDNNHHDRKERAGKDDLYGHREGVR